MGFGVLFNKMSAAAAALGGEPVGLVLFFVALAVGVCIHALLSVQRAHDFDTIGWLAIPVFIPLLNLIFRFVPGTKTENRFGKPTPPNGTEVIIAAWIVLNVMIVGIFAAVVIPNFMSYSEQTGTFQSE